MDLFSYRNDRLAENQAPLAWRMRPDTVDEIVGQKHLLAPGAAFRRMLEKDLLHSFVLFGPSGTGKTTIAQVVAGMTRAAFIPIKAISAGVSDIRKIAADATDRSRLYSQRTILFVDEIHRFNKSQQDVLLPYVEDGTLTMIGATTENPLYELNSALLSRLKVYVLEPLGEADIKSLVRKAMLDPEKGLGKCQVSITPGALDTLAANARGDARIALNMLESLADSYRQEGLPIELNESMLQTFGARLIIKYDRNGDFHYDAISAFIKSVRGSNPDAALFWLATMLEGGEDPKFIARRLLILAAEDIGLADPQALVLANATVQAVQFIGMPEARIPLSECTIYLACSLKSNSAYEAVDNAIKAVRASGKHQVPAHLADSSHSRSGQLLGKGIGYQYPHAFGGWVEQQYMPDGLAETAFYTPGHNPEESRLQKILKYLNNPASKGGDR